MRLFRPANGPPWLLSLIQSIERAFAEQALERYTVANLPPAALPSRIIIVTNETGGEVPAWNDGTDWRRVTDRAVVS